MKLAIIGANEKGRRAFDFFTDLGAHTILIDRDKEYLNSIKADVIRIQKRFLARDEIIKNHTRMHDLFRVVYSVNPKESILQQVQENPEIFNSLGSAVLDSLNHPVESYVDVDFIIDATNHYQHMGPGGTPAINELNLKNTSAIYYGHFDLKANKIALIGNSSQVEEFWKSNPQMEIHWILDEEKYSGPYSAANLKQNQDNLLIAENKFQEDIYRWRNLEDHIREKTARPVEPTAKITCYTGFSVTNIDRLLDQDGLFITIEAAHFKDTSPSNLELKTIAIDKIFVMRKSSPTKFYSQNILINEPGIYFLNDLTLEEILSDLNLYFSKGEAH